MSRHIGGNDAAKANPADHGRRTAQREIRDGQPECALPPCGLGHKDTREWLDAYEKAWSDHRVLNTIDTWRKPAGVAS